MRVLPAAMVVSAASLAVRRRLWNRRAIDLEGRVVLITGGSRGLGLELARVFADEGARLALLARDADALERARQEIAGRGAQVAVFACDLRDPDDIDRTVSSILSRFGGVDVLVNNAGVILGSPLDHVGEEDFEEAMNVHFRAPLRLTRALIPVLGRRGKGRVVQIASIGGLVAVPHLLPYCASKFALVGLSDGLRAELSGSGIRVTTVCPGLMRTGSHVNAWFKGRHKGEFTIFALLGSSPLTSMDAERAARRIVEACRRGEPFLVLGLPARALRLAATLAPSFYAEINSWVARRLPGPIGPEGDLRKRGRDSSSILAPSILTRLADRATRRNNELIGPEVESGGGANEHATRFGAIGGP